MPPATSVGGPRACNVRTHEPVARIRDGGRARVQVGLAESELEESRFRGFEWGAELYFDADTVDMMGEHLYRRLGRATRADAQECKSV